MDISLLDDSEDFKVFQDVLNDLIKIEKSLNANDGDFQGLVNESLYQVFQNFKESSLSIEELISSLKSILLVNDRAKTLLV
ncbi:hypothetical protein [Acinetobacter sp. ANC 4173]|uniref:hypothetical protein n=1 Tax=Acinetobacter sp. ANC 4173 TaxID=2529837 RepID=UPI00103B9226|nr:hypothetical protein [Acinetobacter sp. ANC 4173]TCB79528.1 hypothetical protein E0H94_09995 [Acinetobacter sp. ANC 4173]